MMFAEKSSSEEETPSALELNRTFAEQTLSSTAPAMVLMPNATFAARFCLDQGISFAEFETVVFESTLYPVARQLRTLLGLKRGYFAWDFEFIASVGRATTLRELDAAVTDFTDSRLNEGFFRGTLRLRLSARKLRRLARKYLRGTRIGDPTNGPVPGLEVEVAADKGRTRMPFSTRTVRATDKDEQSVTTLRSTPPAASKTKASDLECSALKQEVARLTEQREVLKKTVGIFCETAPGRIAPPN